MDHSNLLGHSTTSLLDNLLNLVSNWRIALSSEHKMSPTVGPEPTLSLPNYTQPAPPSKRASTSLRTTADDPGIGASPGYAASAASSVSIPFDNVDVDVVRVDGLRHADIKLEARLTSCSIERSRP